MARIIGREKEITLLRSLMDSEKSEFVAVYGRRRVGKTFLIRNAFEYQFSFQVTALGNAKLTDQLANFNIALQTSFGLDTMESAGNWLMAFQKLAEQLELSRHKKKTVFIDELPWFDTRGSGFIQALEHFWNSWASAREDIILVVCGSAASWMINKLINNRGGLHNRVTRRIKLMPFSLYECELFLQSRDSVLDRYQIVQLYMVLGGIPFYWEEIKAGRSAVQNIGEICFSETGLLRNEYSNLYRSLFRKSKNHKMIIEALATKTKGLTREEIVDSTGLPNGGSTTRVLKELEESGFIRKYAPFGKKNRNSLYQLSDHYSLFYLQFIRESQPGDEANWLSYLDHPKYRTWCGYAFEQIGLYHLPQIKHALGISGVQTNVSSWRATSGNGGAQIDLLIDRRDHVINLVEMKFSIHPYVIDNKYAEALRKRVSIFTQETGTRKSVFLTMLTSFGVKPNKHSIGLVQNDLSLEDLFSA